MRHFLPLFLFIVLLLPPTQAAPKPIYVSWTKLSEIPQNAWFRGIPVPPSSPHKEDGQYNSLVWSRITTVEPANAASNAAVAGVYIQGVWNRPESMLKRWTWTNDPCADVVEVHPCGKLVPPK